MIKLNNVVFNYQSMPMVFDLQIQAQEKIAIIGESGAGKSTLLNLIAGFEYADSGEIWLNGENHTKTAPFERHVSMLFQENNLFTHLSVEENIALGLKPNLALNAEEKALVEQAQVDKNSEWHWRAVCYEINPFYYWMSHFLHLILNYALKCRI